MGIHNKTAVCLYPGCGKPTYPNTVSGMCAECAKRVRREARDARWDAVKAISSALPPVPVEAKIDQDRTETAAKQDARMLRDKYRAVLKQLQNKEAELEASLGIAQVDASLITIEPKRSTTSDNEGTVVVLASDWHLEERVLAKQVSGLNEFNLEVAQRRVTKFFQSVLRLTRLLQNDLEIPTMVLTLLGDFITGQIHGAENAETNLLTPNEAIVFAQQLLIAGIEMLLRETELDFVIPCHSGNHARTTLTTRFGSENGHSLEYLLYRHLATHFRHEPRIVFQIADGMHSYVDIYGRTIRFQHGHAIKYGGGIGGLTIPTNKAVAQWNRGRVAELDVFGHFHQQFDGGTFICNGSLIGYNSFALSIKAAYEPPRQSLFLIDRKHGRTCMWPIFV